MAISAATLAAHTVRIAVNAIGCALVVVLAL